MDMEIKYQNPSGETVTFWPQRFTPLTCEDFVTAHNTGTNSYEIRADAKAIEICTPNGQIKREERGQITMPIDFHRSLPVYALVEGGWLPPPLVNPPAYLFDRNVIGYIQQISKGNSRDLYTNVDWWLQMIANKAHFNPFLHAFESNKQTIPDLEEFKRSYEEAVEIIRDLFPNAEITEYRDEHFAAALETMADVLKFHAEETEFLQRVAPLIRESVSENSLQRVCEQILTIATDIGLPLKSLPLIATLSCLYEDRMVSGYNAARELLKLRGGPYTSEKAYNVLSDMRGLMFYLAFRALARQVGEEPLAYCTADKAALLFGCGLNSNNVEFRGNELFLSMELSEFLFPRLRSEKRQELARRIEA